MLFRSVLNLDVVDTSAFVRRYLGARPGESERDDRNIAKGSSLVRRRSLNYRTKRLRIEQGGSGRSRIASRHLKTFSEVRKSDVVKKGTRQRGRSVNLVEFAILSSFARRLTTAESLLPLSIA